MADLPARLRNARMMMNYGNGDVRDEPDPLHEEAADAIDELLDALAFVRTCAHGVLLSRVDAVLTKYREQSNDQL